MSLKSQARLVAGDRRPVTGDWRRLDKTQTQTQMQMQSSSFTEGTTTPEKPLLTGGRSFLNFSRANGFPRDGFVEERGDCGRRVVVPGTQGRRLGISLFLPAEPHTVLRLTSCVDPSDVSSVFMPANPGVSSTAPLRGMSCIATPTYMPLPLPAGLRLARDKELTYMASNEAGEDEVRTLGWHYVLWPEREMWVDDFERAFRELENKCTLCEARARAGEHETAESVVDLDFLPDDPLSVIATMALDHMAENCADENTRLFSTLFALHLRGADSSSFAHEASTCPALAEIVATALEQYTVRCPLLWNDAFEAQEVVAEALNTPWERRVPYKPHWEQ